MYLITHNLLGSWQYLYNAGDDEKAQSDFIKALNREPIEENEAIRNGLEFERLVQMNCRGELIPEGHKWLNCINEVSEIVRGGVWQVAAKRVKKIDGIDFLLYGRFDVLKAGTIYDLKFSKSYEVGKYLDKTQHPMYLEIEQGAALFKYVIGEAKRYIPKRIQDRICARLTAI